MKIAHVLGTFDRTGVTTVVIQLSKTMANCGHEVEIIVWCDRKIPDLPTNIKVFKINIFGLSRRPLLGKYIRKLHKYIFADVIYYYLYSVWFSRFLESELRQRDYQQVFFHGMRYYPFFRIDIPHVVVAHSIESLSLVNTPSYIKNVVCKYCLKRIYKDKTILAVSNGVRTDLINNFSADKNKIFCMYNPFNLEDIRKKSNEFLPNFKSLNGYILAMGRISKQKRFDVLLNAYALSRINKHLVIIGSSEKHFTDLKKLASNLHIENNVHFIEHQKNPFPYIKNAKLLVVTSEYEAFGNTIVESLICGVPVVSTDCISRPREILQGNLTSYLAKINDPVDIANKINACLNDAPKTDSVNLKRFEDQLIVNKYLEHALHNS